MFRPVCKLCLGQGSHGRRLIGQDSHRCTSPRDPHRTLSAEVKIPLKPDADNPLWVCVTTEDGFQAWSSPIYAFR